MYYAPGMDTKANRFHPLRDEESAAQAQRLRDMLADPVKVISTPAPLVTADEDPPRSAEGWPTFTLGELIELRGYRFKVGAAEGSMLILQGVGPA